MKNQVSAKRVHIVSVQLVKEGSLLYQSRYITSPMDVVRMMNEHLDIDK